jgi:starch-binding outer membrane protein, SusD/RagB family
LDAPTRRYLASGYVSTDVYGSDNVDPLNIDIRGDGASLLFTDGTVWKYVGLSPNTAQTQGSYYTHWFVYRYAEILMMKAEGLAQQGQGAAALQIVYEIRNRGNALSVTDENPDPADINAVSQFILDERAREFAFEGKRWYDLLRFAKRNNYANLQILLDLVTRSVTPDRQQSAIAKYKDHNSHYFPINAGELLADPNLVQNPYYK